MVSRQRVQLASIGENEVLKCEEDSYLFNSKLDCYQETKFNPKLIRTGHRNRNFSQGPEEVKNHERFKQQELPKLTRIGHLNRHEEYIDEDRDREERLKQEKLPLLSENIQVNKDICELKPRRSWRWRIQKRRVTMSIAKNGSRPQSRRNGFKSSVKVLSPLYLLKKMRDFYVHAMIRLGSRCSPVGVTLVEGDVAQLRGDKLRQGAWRAWTEFIPDLGTRRHKPGDQLLELMCSSKPCLATRSEPGE